MMAARMVATIDEISGGRCGLNIVTGWNKPEYTAMGLWPGDDYFARRYDYAAEYTQVLRALWTQDRVDFHGEFFDLVDADMRPKPLHTPTVVCAGPVAGRPAVHRHLRRPELHHGRALEGRERSRRGSRSSAGQAQRDVGTFALYVVIAEETDAEAERRCAHIVEHADLEAISYMTTGRLARHQPRRHLGAAAGVAGARPRTRATWRSCRSRWSRAPTSASRRSSTRSR